MKQKTIENNHSSIFNHNSQKMKKPVMYGVCFIILTAMYYYLSSRLPFNSDQASILLEAKDILNGNIFLDGWYLSLC